MAEMVPAPAQQRPLPFLQDRRRRDPAIRLFAYIIITTLGIAYVLPFIWMVVTSLKPNTQIFTYPPVWIPRPVVWANYPNALKYIPFFRYMQNTLVIAVLNVLGHVISCSLAAYGFSRISWKGRDTLFFIYLSTMMLPGAVTLIPTFILFSKLNWIGTILPLVVPSFFGGAFFVFMLRQFFMGIPRDLDEAAKIDGCSEFQVFTRICLPLARPALATVALFTFLGAYRDFLGPLIYLTEQEQWTISLGLNMFRNQFGAEWQMMMAASAVTMAPILLLFFLTQKTFIKGLALTGIKG